MQKTAKLIPYSGGDFFITKELLEHINGLCNEKCTFVEVFGGSGYVAQNVDRTKFKTIIYNDINDKLTTFYKMIKENPDQLKEMLSLLPYSRSLNEITTKLLLENKCLGELETAVLMFYASNTSFYGRLDNGFGFSPSYTRNAAKAYSNKIEKITKIAKLWKDIIIENLDFRDVIKRYDRTYTVFYADPPFIDRDEEYYNHNFSINDLRELAQILTQIKGRFLLKLDEKTYSVVQDILPNDRYKVERLERTLMMNKNREIKKENWILVLIESMPSYKINAKSTALKALTIENFL